MNWAQFAAACPELAHLARERFAGDEVVLVATLRRDGSPRISPVEPDFVDDELLVGMMWRSMKARDLERDPRLVVHSVPSDRMNPGGDVKLYGRARDVTDPERRRRFEEAIYARIEWKPTEPYHLFAVEVESAAYVRFEESVWETWRWAAGGELVKDHRPND